jgi:predicted MarR family transcription regulator
LIVHDLTHLTFFIPFLSFNSVKDCKKDLKVKAKAPLTKFLCIVKDTLAEWRREPGTESLRYQLMHMRDILERWKVCCVAQVGELAGDHLLIPRAFYR